MYKETTVWYRIYRSLSNVSFDRNDDNWDEGEDYMQIEEARAAIKEYQIIQKQPFRYAIMQITIISEEVSNE